MQDFIIRTLQKSGIDRNNRARPGCCHTGSHRNGVFFRNADIKEAFRILRCKAVEPRSLRHRSRDSNNAGIRPGKPAQRPREHGRVAFALASAYSAGIDIEFPDSMEFFRILLRERISLSLFCDRMDHDRAIKLFCAGEHFNQLCRIMAVNRAKIGEPHLFKQHVWDEQILDLIFQVQHTAEQPRTNLGEFSQKLSCIMLEMLVGAARAHAVQMPVHSAHIVRNGHIVIVEHNDQRLFALPRIVKRLETESACQCAVAQYGNHAALSAEHAFGAQNAERCGNRSARMARSKSIMWTFRTLRKAADPVFLAEFIEFGRTAGQDLMHIGLMPHIKNDLICRRIKHAVQRDREFYDP